MIEEIYKLYQIIKRMNPAGYEALCVAANDIASHQRYQRDNVEEVKKSQLDKDIDRVLEMVNGNAERGAK